MIQKSFRYLLLFAAFTTLASAQELKVDINNNNRAISEGLDPAYTSWNDVTAWFPSGANSISKGFSGVTVTFTRVGGVGTALKPGYNKPFIQSPTLNVKLTADGITVDGGETGAQIEMRIAGLPAGSHTVAVYHNAWDNLASLAPLNVFLNGTQVATDVPTSVNVTDNLAAGLSYTTVTAVSGQDVVILFAARTSGSEASKNVYINAFEIDTPNPKKLARNPNPAHADKHVDCDSGSKTLNWTGAYDGTAVSHNVYFGTDSAAVANATPASAEYKGNQVSTSYPVTGINPHQTYYWRVDEVGSGGMVTKGNLWYFQPRRLAFPGAEGYGRFARGGRGGVVREVTNLNDSGPGSFRDAVLGNYGPRTVVFTVSGQIVLSDDVIMDSTMPPITVAGQTAPGKGICFRRQQFAMNGALDAIVRHVRIRVGKESGETQNGSGMSGVDHSIMDHCSISWGIDEELSSRNGKNLTFQRCHISEALNIAGHQNYPAGTAHGYAASIGGDTATFHHNLLSHCAGRNWSLAGGLDASGFYSGRLDIFNNVVYNWDGRTTDGGAHEVNFVNNYYKRGPVGGTTMILTAQNDGFPGTQQYYFAGNVMPGYVQVSNQTDGRTTQGPTTSYPVFVNTPFFPSYATIDEVTNAFKKVLSDVGCNQPQIDDHDVRVIRETIDGTYTYSGSISGLPGLPDTTADVGGWEDYGNETRPVNFDTDHDGMPNWWELIKGFNTNSPPGDFSESNSDLDGDEFTALEDYLNWMAEPHYDCSAGTNLDIDLDFLSRGFTNTTYAYSFSSQLNGTVSLVSNRYARFTPTLSSSALASFNYTVTNTGKGYTMTRAVNVRVVGTGAGPTNAPPTPTGFNATAGSGQVSLSWNFAPEASGYVLKRSTTSGSGYVNLATNGPTSYVDTSVVNGTTYYYMVAARNSIGDSTNSTEVFATPQLALPSVPAGLSATASNAQVSLNWSAASGATSYILKRSTTNGSGYVNIVTNASTSHVNTGLANGTTYYYVVSGVNAAGESGNSTQVSATPQIPAPTGLTAVAGNGQVSLNWNAAAGAASYIVKRSTTSGSGYVNVATNATTTFTNTGLANNITYYFVVSALNGPSQSANSGQAAAMPVSGSSISIVDPPSAVVTGSSATTITTPVTVSSAANCLVVLINNMKETATGGWTVTWNGQSLANAVVLQSGSTGAKSAIYYLYNPTTDGLPHNLAVTFTTGATAYHIQYFTLAGVDTAVAPLTGSTNNSGTTQTFNISGCPQNGLAALNAVNSSSSGTTTAITAYGSGTPTVTNITGSSPSCSIGYANYIAGGTDTFTATASVSGKFVFTAAVFMPASSAAPPTAPLLSIRNQAGALALELTGETGRSLTVQSKTNLAAAWINWTNLTGSGTMQLLPLNELTNQSPRYFRAVTQ